MRKKVSDNHSKPLELCSLSTSLYAYTHASKDACMCIHVYICIYVCVGGCVYTHAIS